MSVASLWERRLAYILTLGVVPLYRRNGLGMLHRVCHLPIIRCPSILIGHSCLSSNVNCTQCMPACAWFRGTGQGGSC